MPITATAFETWWQSTENPARNMPATSQDLIKPHMKAAFYGGRNHAKDCIVRKAQRTRDAVPVFTFDD